MELNIDFIVVLEYCGYIGMILSFLIFFDNNVFRVVFIFGLLYDILIVIFIFGYIFFKFFICFLVYFKRGNLFIV